MAMASPTALTPLRVSIMVKTYDSIGESEGEQVWDADEGAVQARLGTRGEGSEKSPPTMETDRLRRTRDPHVHCTQFIVSNPQFPVSSTEILVDRISVRLSDRWISGCGDSALKWLGLR